MNARMAFTGTQDSGQTRFSIDILSLWDSRNQGINGMNALGHSPNQRRMRGNQRYE